MCLAHFDLIAARENQSHNQITRIRPDAMLVPDLLLSADIDTTPTRGIGIGVVDSSARMKSLALMRYAATQGHTFYAMERRLLDKPHLVQKTGLDPNAIQTPVIGDIFNHDAWVVGRFHFAMALLVHGIPFAAQPTQVHKMQAMLHDADTSCPVPVVGGSHRIRKCKLFLLWNPDKTARVRADLTRWRIAGAVIEDPLNT